jgi:hypothetical protein
MLHDSAIHAPMPPSHPPALSSPCTHIGPGRNLARGGAAESRRIGIEHSPPRTPPSRRDLDPPARRREVFLGCGSPRSQNKIVHQHKAPSGRNKFLFVLFLAHGLGIAYQSVPQNSQRALDVLVQGIQITGSVD